MNKWVDANDAEVHGARKAGPDSVTSRTVMADESSARRLVNTLLEDDGEMIHGAPARGVLPDPKAYAALNAKAEDFFGEYGFSTCSEDEMNVLVDMRRANRIAEQRFGEFGLATCSEDEIKTIITEHPDLVRPNPRRPKGVIMFSDDDPALAESGPLGPGSRSTAPRIRQSPNSEELSDWLNKWCMKHGSCIEVWGPDKAPELKKLADQGCVFKTSSSFGHVERLVKQGWTLFDDEFNGGDYDAILYRKP